MRILLFASKDTTFSQTDKKFNKSFTCRHEGDIPNRLSGSGFGVGSRRSYAGGGVRGHTWGN